MITLYKKKDAAKILGINVQTLDKLVRNGEIDSTLIGSQRMFFEYHLVKYAKKNEIINLWVAICWFSDSTFSVSL